jgi:hypothetical protein
MMATLKRLTFVLALVGAPAAWAQMPAGPAFMMEARVGGGLSVQGNGGGGASAELAFGVRLIDRLQVGLGFTVFHTSTAINGAAATTQTTFTLNPQITVDILKARDNKVAWYGKVGLPIGAAAQTANVVNGATNTVFAIGFDLGLGLRYCPHPNVAFGLEGGINGFYTDVTTNGGTGTVGVYGAAVGTFYWGKGT